MFKENYVITGTIVCKTGLHIGGSNDSVEIGGSDNVVIRDSITKRPFIPGSSLKGKLRSLIELNDPVFVTQLVEKMKENKDITGNEESDIAVKVFGGSVENKTLKFPTRIIVRDSFPTEETIEMWDKYNDVIDGAELKYENRLNRVKSEATPRNIERVPKGSKFSFEIIFSYYDEDESNNIMTIIGAMTQLEDNYLGGSGSRGFGQVAFEDISIVKRGHDFYVKDGAEDPIVCNENLENTRKILSDYLN